MSAATDLLAAVNDRTWDASTNPNGLHDSGYLENVGGVHLTARVCRAHGTATQEENDAQVDINQAQIDTDAIEALVSPADAARQAAQEDATLSQTAANTAVNSVPVALRLYF